MLGITLRPLTNEDVPRQVEHIESIVLNRKWRWAGRITSTMNMLDDDHDSSPDRSDDHLKVG